MMNKSPSSNDIPRATRHVDPVARCQSMDNLPIRHSLTPGERRGSLMQLSKWKLVKVKYEFKGLYNKVRGSSANQLCPSDAEDVCRTIKVEFIDSSVTDECFEDTEDVADHDYSSSLQLTDLRDGCFSAELPLDALPLGHITLRIRNYTIEVVVAARRLLPSSPSVAFVQSYAHHGYINIPIYVDPESLSFEVDDDGYRLHVHGLVKGYNGPNAQRKTSATVASESPTTSTKATEPKRDSRMSHRRSISVSNITIKSFRSRTLSR